MTEVGTYECNRRNMTWKGDRLFAVGIKRPVAEIVRDAKYPAVMWRFRLLPDGELSDMVNLSRAKDAAITAALADLNRKVPVLRQGPPRIDETPALVPEPPPTQKPLYGATV